MLGIIESDIAKTDGESRYGTLEDISFGAEENASTMPLEGIMAKMRSAGGAPNPI